MTPETRHEHIEAYLDGRMSPEERLRFEEALAQDDTLTRELALHRELQDTLGDREWLARRRQLAGLAGEFHNPPGSGRPRRLWWLLAVLGFGILLLWWLRRETPPPVSEGQVSEAPADRDAPDPDSDGLTADPSGDEPAKAPAGQAAETAHDPFRPLPELEEALTRPADTELTVDQPFLELEPSGAGAARLRFRGLLRSAQDPPSLELHLRDNRPATRRPLERLPVQVTPLADPPVRAFAAKKEWQLQADAPVRLAPGRYYGSLLRSDDGRILWTGVLEVR